MAECSNWNMQNTQNQRSHRLQQYFHPDGHFLSFYGYFELAIVQIEFIKNLPQWPEHANEDFSSNTVKSEPFFSPCCKSRPSVQRRWMHAMICCKCSMSCGNFKIIFCNYMSGITGTTSIPRPHTPCPV